MRGEVDGVDVQPGAGGVHPLGHRRQVRAGADQVGRAGDRDHPGPLREGLVEGVQGQLAGLRVEVDPAHGRAGGLGRDHPRPDVAVVVEPAHHDLVARAPVLGHRAAEVEGELGEAAPEHDAVRRRVQQVRERLAGADDRALGVLLGDGEVAAVGQRAEQGGPHRVGHRRRRLRAARPVEERQPALEGGEVGADLRDVVLTHDASLGAARVGRLRSDPECLLADQRDRRRGPAGARRTPRRAGPAGGEEPRVEEVVELLARDLLGQGDELRGRRRCRRPGTSPTAGGS